MLPPLMVLLSCIGPPRRGEKKAVLSGYGRHNKHVLAAAGERLAKHGPLTSQENPSEEQFEKQ